MGTLRLRLSSSLLIMLVAAAIIAGLSGLLLGYAKARAEEAHTTAPATPH